jgi:Flp pilus assembly CpaF family ATPase
LGLGKPLVDRATTAFKFWDRLLPDGIEDVFVSEYVSDEGDRTYDSLWFLTHDFMIEAHQFVTLDNADIVPLPPRIGRIEVDRRDFELDRATERSRMTVEITLGPPAVDALTGTLRASGDNCLKLQELVEKYFLPSLLPGLSSKDPT